MANYNTHVVAGALVGVGAVALGHNLWPEAFSVEAYGLAFAAAYVGGLLPDLDHDVAIGLGEVSALCSTLAPILLLANLTGENIQALAAVIPCHHMPHGLLRRLKRLDGHHGPWPGFRAVVVASLCSAGFMAFTEKLPWPWVEVLGTMIGISVLVMVALPVFKRLTTHRGIFHSVPAVLIYTLGLYLAAFRYEWSERLLVGLAGGGGVLIHLILDEIYAVDLGGVRLKQSFGTALSVWKAKTPVISTLAYVLTGVMGVACLWL